MTVAIMIISSSLIFRLPFFVHSIGCTRELKSSSASVHNIWMQTEEQQTGGVKVRKGIIIYSTWWCEDIPKTENYYRPSAIMIILHDMQESSNYEWFLSIYNCNFHLLVHVHYPFKLMTVYIQFGYFQSHSSIARNQVMKSFLLLNSAVLDILCK